MSQFFAWHNLALQNNPLSDECVLEASRLLVSRVFVTRVINPNKRVPNAISRSVLIIISRHALTLNNNAHASQKD
jgi:hypothetical protein